jgi:hypothetical protein
MKLSRNLFFALTMGNRARQRALLASAKSDGDYLVIPDALWTQVPQLSKVQPTVRPIGDCIQARHPLDLAKAQPVEPSIKDMVRNLASALKVWASAGFPVLSEAEARARGVVCAGNETRPKCDFWRPEARGGMGKCMICGCTSIKWWLSTAKCPKAKWKK